MLPEGNHLPAKGNACKGPRLGRPAKGPACHKALPAKGICPCQRERLPKAALHLVTALIYMLAAIFAQVVEKMPVKKQGKRPALRKQVASWGLPPLWVPIVVGCLCATAAKDLHGVEIFAGAKAVANGFHDAGLHCATIELNDGEDITTTAGLKLTISYICRCKEKALVWLGTPCSSWIFVGRSNAER